MSSSARASLRPASAAPVSSRTVESGTARRRRRPQTSAAPTAQPEEEEEAPGWPELPPVYQLRTGIARENVGRGLDYCLPVDKGRLSVGNDYRMDLRAMFQEPYMQVSRVFDAARMHEVTKHHLRPNTAQTPSRKDVARIIDSFAIRTNDDAQLRKVSSGLSSAPKRVLAHYCNTSPENRSLFTPDRMQTRSKLFVPFKVPPSPASTEARAKAASILRELNIGQEDSREEGDAESSEKKEEEKEAKRTAERPLTRLKNAGIGCYDDTKRLGPTFRPEMPENARSPFLNEEANSKIWTWLTDPTVMSDFEYFMVLCK